MTEPIATEKTKRRLSYPMFPFKDAGDVLVGRIVERATVEIGERTRGKYIIADEKAELWLVYGSGQLDDALDRSTEGALIEITYKGTFEATSGFPTKLYEVYELEE